jgi:hypothetical protein
VGEAGVDADEQRRMGDRRDGLGQRVWPARLTMRGSAAAMRAAASASAGPPRITGTRPVAAISCGARACQASSNQCFWGRVVKGASTA